MRRLWSIVHLAGVGLVCLYLLLPTLVVALASISPGSAIRLPPDGFSLRWYANFFAREDFRSSLLLSGSLALGVAFAATALSLFLSVSCRWRPGRAASLVEPGILLPVLLPTIVLAPAILITAAQIGLTTTFAGTLAVLAGVHLLLTLPYTHQAVASSYATVAPALEDAASIAGAGPWLTLSRIALPLAAPGLAAGFLLAFLVSFDEPVVALFMTRHDLVTMPQRVFTYLRFRADPTIAAFSTVMSLVSIVAMLLVDRLVGLDRMLGLRR